MAFLLHDLSLIMMILDRQYLYTSLPNASSILAQSSQKQAHK
ncbi:hypothetical protein [Acinetobacter sedimenti]|nr:hypothetical protein [Acinetobacter sedimenti]